MADIQIWGTEVSAQRSLLFSLVSESLKSGRPMVLFAPEQYTLQAERDLMTGLNLPGLLNLDVVSPTRLKSLVSECAGGTGRRPLDELGRSMAVHQAVHSCGSGLTYYRQAEALGGAVSRMDQTLSELQEESLTPGALEELSASAGSSALRAKYLDLSIIWREYDALLQNRFDDSASSWQDLCRRLPASGLLSGKDFIVYGFDTVRPDLRDLLLAAAECCHAIRVLLIMAESSAPTGRIFRVQRDSAAALSAALEKKGVSCRLSFLPPAAPPQNALRFLEQNLFSGRSASFPDDPAPLISLYAAPNPTEEALSAASRLYAWHRQGIPWNRMAVALPQGASHTETLLAALRRHEIPYFISRKDDIARHGVSRLLAGALSCVSRGLATEPLLEMASSGFGTLSREEGARLSEYVRARGIEYGRWRVPFTRGDRAEEAEALRQRLLGPVVRLHDALRNASGARESLLAVYSFLREEGVYDQLRARQRRLMESGHPADAVVDRQVWALLMNLLDQLHALLEGSRPSMKEIALLITGALERASLSSLPEEEEGVLIGRIGHMLPGQIDALILPGMNEGVLTPARNSLLTDAERHALEESVGRAVGMDASRMGMMMRSDFLRTMSLPEKHLWVSCCLRDEDGSALLPGEPVAELRRLFPLLREEGGLSADPAAALPSAASFALEKLGPLLRALAIRQREDLSPLWQSAVRSLLRDRAAAPVLKEMLSPYLRESPPRRLSPRTALRLFHGDRVSISRLECFAGCPFQHFLRYGLRPVQPGSFEFTAGDAGTFFHQALQEYLDQAVREPSWPRLPEDRIAALLEEILTRLTLPWEEGPLRGDASGRWQGEEYLRRVRHAASVLTLFAANGDFQVLGTEVAFGTGRPGDLPPLVLRLRDGAEIALQGQIDRLDLYRGASGDYLRVLDLKSSEKELDPARMNRGEQLQLMIYLLAAMNSRAGSHPAGALYFPIQDREVSARTPESAEAERLRNVSLRGVALAEEEVLRAMDRDQSPFSLPKIFNQDGSISRSAGWVLSEDALRRLMEAAREKAAELCERIRSGETDASPSVSDRQSACTFCEFQAVCSRRKQDERPLPKGVAFSDVGNLPDK